MKKTILLPMLFAISLITISSTSVIGEGNNQNDRTFADLTDHEKKEAIAHMLSTGDCEWEGIKLYGKVQFVTSFPDIKIQYVTSFPDIKVKFVDSFPDDCGEWQEVSSFPDFKVQVVTSFPDIKVQKVDSFPGMN